MTTPKTFVKSCAQGDIRIIKLNDVPSLDGLEEVKREGGKLIVTHSETGHHHVLERPTSRMFQSKDNDFEAIVLLDEADVLKHERPYDTHAPIAMAPGAYKVKRQREHTPEGYRRVAD